MARYKHRLKVRSIEAYKEAIEAASKLGLEVADVGASRHGWETPDADSLHPRGEFEIAKVGRKYIHFDFRNAGKCRGEFGRDYDGDKAYLELRFN